MIQIQNALGSNLLKSLVAIAIFPSLIIHAFKVSNFLVSMSEVFINIYNQLVGRGNWNKCKLFFCKIIAVVQINDCLYLGYICASCEKQPVGGALSLYYLRNVLFIKSNI